MAYAPTTHTDVQGNLILRALSSVWNKIVYLGETSARAHALREINEISDQQLEAAGVTRQELVRRVFSDSYM